MMPYTYFATATRIVDGDTLDIRLDLGFGLYREMRVRLLGVDTPELRSSNAAEREKAKAAKARLESLVGTRKLTVETYLVGESPEDKYGRVLARVTPEDSLVDVATVLLNEGHARSYGGGKREPWP